MRTIYFLKGLQGSGKSTWSKEKIQELKNNVVYINNDSMLNCFFNGKWSRDNQKIMENIESFMIYEAFRYGKDIILDNTHLNSRHEKRIRKILNNLSKLYGTQNLKFEIVDHFINVDVYECIERDSKRENSVGRKVIMDTYNRAITKWKDYNRKLKDYRNVEMKKHDHILPNCIIVDMDGTLAINNGHRSYYDASTADKDDINNPVKELIEDITYSYKSLNESFYVIIFSGRENKNGSYEATERFLINYNIPYDNLVLRSKNDHRDDCIVKKEMYEKYVNGKYNVKFILDDRNKVVQMWRDLGLPCFQVAWGDF